MLVVAVAYGMDPAAACNNHHIGGDGREISRLIVNRHIAQAMAGDGFDEVGLVVDLAGGMSVNEIVGKNRGHLVRVAGDDGRDPSIVGIPGAVGFGIGHRRQRRSDQGDQRKKGQESMHGFWGKLEMDCGRVWLIRKSGFHGLYRKVPGSRLGSGFSTGDFFVRQASDVKVRKLGSTSPSKPSS